MGVGWGGGGGGELEREGERRVSGRMGQERQGRKEHDCELLACPSCGMVVCVHMSIQICSWTTHFTFLC